MPETNLHRLIPTLIEATRTSKLKWIKGQEENYSVSIPIAVFFPVTIEARRNRVTVTKSSSFGNPEVLESLSANATSGDIHKISNLYEAICEKDQAVITIFTQLKDYLNTL